MSSAYLLIALLLLQQAAPGGQPKPASPAPSAPAEKKKLGPPAGTPGRAARLLIIVTAADPSSALDPLIHETEQAIAAALIKQGATVLERASLTTAQNELAVGQSGAISSNAPALMKLLNVDGVIYAQVASERVVMGIRRPYESRVSLRLVGYTGATEAAAEGRAQRSPGASIVGSPVDDSSQGLNLRIDGVKAAAADGLNQLLTNVEIATR